MEPNYKPYVIAKERGLLITNPKTGEPVVGKVWQNETVWIDFTNPNSTDFWVEMWSDFHKKLPFDALWIVSDK